MVENERERWGTVENGDERSGTMRNGEGRVRNGERSGTLK